MPRREEANNHQNLNAAKRSYRAAVETGNRQEEARWANVIGHILKDRGEYVEALRWLRKDYDVSMRYLPEKQLLATCQSLGELHLRLQEYEQALIYQKKHFELAKVQNDLIEQQRACTQLGRTYHEMFLKSDDDHHSIRKAKKYFKSAMELAEAIMDNPPSGRVSFVKEYIDAYNNIGMLEIDLENFDAAEKLLCRGLEICDEEEVIENDDARSRLHHNLGNLYLELRKWEKAHKHIKKDILLCKQIGHLQGEAKGYINLGELLYRKQMYTEATASYQKALDLAKSLEDEHALVDQISQNIETVREAVKVMDELKQEEQKLKKLKRRTEMSRGSENEWKCLRRQSKSLDSLVEKSRMILDWIKLLQHAKKKKKIAGELCDKEKLSDSFLIIGESYQKLRKFNKALKWYRKAWETYRLIGNSEGQVLAKINVGEVLDSTGDWHGALEAFKEGYKAAVGADLPYLQLSALENVHYSHMIRFNDAKEARKIKLLIEKLKKSKDGKLKPQVPPADSCSETNTELDDHSLDDASDGSFSKNQEYSTISASLVDIEQTENRNFAPILQNEIIGMRCGANSIAPSFSGPHKSQCCRVSEPSGSYSAKRKRAHAIISDDEAENGVNSSAERMTDKHPKEISTSDEVIRNCIRSSVDEAEIASPVTSRYTTGELQHANQESTSCSPRSNIFSNILVKFDQEFVYLDLDTYGTGDKLSLEWIKVELACLYYLKLLREKRSKGLVPLIQNLMYNGRTLESEELKSLADHAHGSSWIEACAVMVPKSLMKLYISCCETSSVPPNMTLVHKLYDIDVSEDEILVSDCQLQDFTIAPLLDALILHKPLAVLDLSHNLLGNSTVEKLKQVFISSSQSYGSLFLNLHNNRLGPAALFEICECPVLYARLEALNISGNCLTDACASYLATIIRTCKALYSVNVENCQLTSRTIQRIADSVETDTSLTHLYIGLNHPVSGNVVISLVLKLAALNRFQELSLRGIKLSKPVVYSICQLANNCCLSGLLLGKTNIGNEGALQLIQPLSKDTQELVRLDLSFSGLTYEYAARLCKESSLTGGILELNLGGNPIAKEGASEIASLLRNRHCCLRLLEVYKCELGPVGIIRILQALAENHYLEELNVADNVDTDNARVLTSDPPTMEGAVSSKTNLNLQSSTPPAPKPEELDDLAKETGITNTDDQLEAADSEDDEIIAEAMFRDTRDKISISPEDVLSLRDPMQELAASIRKAERLKKLDLSHNGFSPEIVEVLFSAWSSGCRAGVAQRHVDGNVVHFSVQGFECCRIKPCCRRI